MSAPAILRQTLPVHVLPWCVVVAVAASRAAAEEQHLERRHIATTVSCISMAGCRLQMPMTVQVSHHMHAQGTRNVNCRLSKHILRLANWKRSQNR